MFGLELEVPFNYCLWRCLVLFCIEDDELTMEVTKENKLMSLSTDRANKSEPGRRYR